MPFTSDILDIQLTKCNNLLALILRNNNLIVFDLNAGICFDYLFGFLNYISYYNNFLNNSIQKRR
jgi:hypothetical protein